MEGPNNVGALVIKSRCFLEVPYYKFMGFGWFLIVEFYGALTECLYEYVLRHLNYEINKP